MGEQSTSQAILSCLRAARVARIYGLFASPTPLHRELEAVRGEIRYIAVRNELTAVAMADAEGRLTGRPGIVLLDAGAGVLNSATGLATAAKDCSPLLAIATGVQRQLAGSGGALDLDQAAALSCCVKAYFRVLSAAEAVETFLRAWQTAATAPPGPVVLEIPGDLWEESATASEVSPDDFEIHAPPAPRNIHAVIDGLRAAERPLLLAGGGLQGVADSVLRLVESARLPVITTGNGRGVIPEDHLLCFGRAGYGGGSGAADYALASADYVLCLGCGLSDLVTYNYSRHPKARLAFIDANGSYLRQLEQRFPDAALLEGDAPSALEQLRQSGLKGLCRDAWWQCLEVARMKWQSVVRQCAFPGEPLLATFVAWRLRPMLPRNTIVICGPGRHLLPVNTAVPCYGSRQYLSSCNFGADGFALGAAMAARLLFPERRVVCAMSDRDFLMSSPDLETAIRLDAMPLVLLFSEVRAPTDASAVAAAYHVRSARATHPGEVDTICGRGLDPGGAQLLQFEISRDEQPPANWAAIAGM